MDDLTQIALNFVNTVRWHTLPCGVQHQAKRSLLDALGCLLAGTQVLVAEIMSDLAHDEFPGEKATVLCSGKKVSTVGAALANGHANNAIDIDDGHWKAKGHPGAVILPGLLAISEMPEAKKTGKDFLTAMVVGYELAIRAAIIRHSTYKSYHNTGSWAPIGIAGAAGNLLSLDQEVTRHAIGIAEYHAAFGPMLKGLSTTCMAKEAMGWAAMVGVSSVLMARKGFTGIQPLFHDAPDMEVVRNLGTHWEILELYFKSPLPQVRGFDRQFSWWAGDLNLRNDLKYDFWFQLVSGTGFDQHHRNERYAACRFVHAPISGVLKILNEMNDANLTLDSIEKINILTFECATTLPTSHPKDTEAAQYNMAYPVAAALIDGTVGPKQVLPPRIFDQDVLDLADKVDVQSDKVMTQLYGEGRRPAEVTVITIDGQVFKSGLVEPKWDKGASPTDSELEDKFKWLVEPVLGRNRTEELVQVLWNFEDLENVADLIKRLCVKS